MGTQSYTIAYATNGGTLVNNDIMYAGTSIKLPSTTYSGHSFNGWYYLVNGVKGSFVGKAGDTFTPTGDAILIAD